MKISFFAIFTLVGLILLILSLIFKNKDKKMVEQCTLTTKGKVILGLSILLVILIITFIATVFRIRKKSNKRKSNKRKKQ